MHFGSCLRFIEIYDLRARTSSPRWKRRCSKLKYMRVPATETILWPLLLPAPDEMPSTIAVDSTC